MYDLTIVVPGIRPGGWERLWKTAERSIGKFTFEIIFVGPLQPSQELLTKPNVRYIEDYGSATRCTQLGTLLATGRLFTWASDDGYFIENALEEAIQLYWDIASNTLAENHQIVMRYLEGPNFQGNPLAMPDDYWRAHHHASLRLPGIPSHFLTAPLGMLSLQTFKDYGGFDCRFEHITLVCVDLSFRLQRDGGKLYLSPTLVLNCDKGSYEENSPVEIAYRDNDLPLFQKIYSDPDALKSRYVKFNNWADASPIWKRRYVLISL